MDNVMNKRNNANKASTLDKRCICEYINQTKTKQFHIYIITNMSNLHKYLKYSKDNKQIMAYKFKQLINY